MLPAVPAVHPLAAHPTPPAFDGPADRNGRRNRDEIHRWADCLTGDRAAARLVDNAGVRGGLEPGSRFVIAGDSNAEPVNGDPVDGAINRQLLHRRISDRSVTAGVGAAGAPGNVRIDYLLPSKNLDIR